jgi:hypothetical protein
LADDLDRIARGGHPGNADLLDAPLLLEWRLWFAPVPHLVGIVL